MSGRFTSPPDVRANTRRRLLVLRTSMARRFAPSPYAGTDVPRHHPPLQLHCSYPEQQRRLSMLRRQHHRIASEGAHSFSSERIAAFFGCPAFIDPRSDLVQECSQATFTDIYPAYVQHFNPGPIRQLYNSCSSIVRTCSFRSQSISSHGTLYSEVSNAHLCRKLTSQLANSGEYRSQGVCECDIGMRVKERG